MLAGRKFIARSLALAAAPGDPHARSWPGRFASRRIDLVLAKKS